MIEMVHILGHKVTAEGVEEKEQLTMLQELGCDRIQEYYYSKSVSAEKTSKLLVGKFLK